MQELRAKKKIIVLFNCSIQYILVYESVLMALCVWKIPWFKLSSLILPKAGYIIHYFLQSISNIIILNQFLTLPLLRLNRNTVTHRHYVSIASGVAVLCIR